MEKDPYSDTAPGRRLAKMGCCLLALKSYFHAMAITRHGSGK
ncbi:hypothetical protein [Polaromonas hydrogenivorans]